MEAAFSFPVAPAQRCKCLLLAYTAQMEILFILWLAYMVFIGTRTAEQRQNHLALLWASMALMLLVSLLYVLGRVLL